MARRYVPVSPPAFVKVGEEYLPILRPVLDANEYLLQRCGPCRDGQEHSAERIGDTDIKCKLCECWLHDTKPIWLEGDEVTIVGGDSKTSFFDKERGVWEHSSFDFGTGEAKQWETPGGASGEPFDGLNRLANHKTNAWATN
ncbi:MAG: hypothetical protein KGL39_38650, partial [Patescibacteria group bacterium]|nr:hypothetical protein [Patescibacteria group bacterium]